MSGGESRKSYCNEVLAEVWLLLDKEATPARDAELRRHLAECGPCLAEYGLEEKLKTLLARTCGGEIAPPALHERLRDQIRGAVVEQAEVSVERGPAGTVIEVNHSRVESWRLP